MQDGAVLAIGRRRVVERQILGGGAQITGSVSAPSAPIEVVLIPAIGAGFRRALDVDVGALVVEPTGADADVSFGLDGGGDVFDQISAAQAQGATAVDVGAVAVAQAGAGVEAQAAGGGQHRLAAVIVDDAAARCDVATTDHAGVVQRGRSQVQLLGVQPALVKRLAGAVDVQAAAGGQFGAGGVAEAGRLQADVAGAGPFALIAQAAAGAEAQRSLAGQGIAFAEDIVLAQV